MLALSLSLMCVSEREIYPSKRTMFPTFCEEEG